MRTTLLFVLLAIVSIGFLTNCNREMGGSGNPYVAPIPGDSVLIPAQMLNYWVYNVKQLYDFTQYDTMITIQMDTVTEHNNTYWFYDPWIGGYIHNFPDGVWVMTHTTIPDTILYLKYPVSVGDKWYIFHDSTICMSTTDTARLGNTMYYDCIRYRQTYNGRYWDEVYKPGIGMVRCKTDTNYSSIYNYEVLTLQSYRLY